MYDKSKTVITYLAQNTKKDILYGRDSRSFLEKSLDLLYKNYNNQFKHDIIIFYDNFKPFDIKSQIEISKGRKEIKFYNIPDNIWNNKTQIDKDKCVAINKFAISYRNMCKFYAINIFDICKKLNYKWIMRLDDDSFIHSKINYDLFNFMYNNNKLYAFRCFSTDGQQFIQDFPEFCSNYLITNNIQDNMLKLFSKNKNNNFNINNFNLIGPYTNFFIANIDFWTSQNVQKFLNIIIDCNYIYYKRWGDLIIHTAVIYMFLKPRNIHQFDDFIYEHSTIIDNKLVWGGKFNINNFSNIKKTEQISNKLNIIENYSFKNNINDLFLIGKYNNIDDIKFIIKLYKLNTNENLNLKFKFKYTNSFIFDKNDNNLYAIINNNNNDNNNNNINTLFVRYLNINKYQMLNNILDDINIIEAPNKIRLGNKDTDGGYVISDLKNLYDCYLSCGVNNEESFTRDFLKKYNYLKKENCFAFDGTIKDYPWKYTKDINFIKKNIGNHNSDKITNLSEYLINYKNIFIKMDIEGGEWEWLSNIDESKLNNIKQLVIEFHGINDDTWGEKFENKVKCLKKLNKSHYMIHFHGNNCAGFKNINGKNIPDVVEITYIRKPYFEAQKIPIKLNKQPLPHPMLDTNNKKGKEDYNLNFEPFVFN